MSPFLFSRPLSAVLLSAFLLSGCAGLLETDVPTPNVTVPTVWSQQAATSAVRLSAVDPWWKAFHDPHLDALIERALANNNDLATAALTLRKARLQAGLSERALWPSLSVDGKETLEKPLTGTKKLSRGYSLDGSVSYEVDLWGKLSRQADADLWEAQASAMDRDSAALSLTATTATLYWQVLYYRQRLSIARESIAYTRETQDLVQVQFDSGAASPLELYESTQSVEKQEAEATQIEQSLIESENALAILFNGPPGVSMVDGQVLDDHPLPLVQAGIPADVLGRRPDVHAAELRLHEAVASVDATRANYFPSFSLTGSVGSSSIALKDILTNPVAALGIGLSLPFLNWNEMSLTIKVSKVEAEQAMVTYRQTLYAALSEVENALADQRTTAQQGEHLNRAFDAATEAERIYRVRYTAGAVSLQDWLDAQESRRTLQASVLENRLNRRLALVTLYKVLGGGTGETGEQIAVQ